MKFEELQIEDSILASLKEAGYEKPTKIQEEVIPILLEGNDVLASSQTGTGKTAAYTIPMLQTISSSKNEKGKKRPVRGLVLSPTRELAAQIGSNIDIYSKNLKLKKCVIFGGVPQSRQVNSMRKGVDVIVATPGRLIDLCNQKVVDLSTVEILILDEVDQMLDMGFLPEVKKIINKCENRTQTMMFSATIPQEIIKLSNSICNDPKRVAVVPVNQPLDSIDQSVYKLDQEYKKRLLIHLLNNPFYESVLIFARTKHTADRLGDFLTRKEISNRVIHGNKSQAARTNALKSFKDGKSRVLVATDIVSRGIDVKNISLVINYDLPQQNETYLHRMGRTGRAGFSGKVISFCSKRERGLLKSIERYIGMSIPEKFIHKIDFSNISIRDKSKKKNKKTFKNKSAHFRNKDFEVTDKRNERRTGKHSRKISNNRKRTRQTQVRHKKKR